MIEVDAEYTEEVSLPSPDFVVRRVPIWSFVYDLKKKEIVYSNPLYNEVGTYLNSAKGSDNMLVRALMNPKDCTSFEMACKTVLSACDDNGLYVELRLKLENGSLRWIATRVEVFVRDQDGAPAQLLGVMEDVTEIKDHQKRVEFEAAHDGLTRLLNRRALLEKLKLNIAQGRQALTACICDIDNFKSVNDRYGHIAGDEVLCTFAKILTEELSGSTAMGRLGGDEFCVLFPGVQRDDAAVAMEHVRRCFAESLFRTSNGRVFSATASFGLAVWKRGTSWKVLMNQADKALFEAKRNGRNQVA